MFPCFKNIVLFDILQGCEILREGRKFLFTILSSGKWAEIDKDFLVKSFSLNLHVCTADELCTCSKVSTRQQYSNQENNPDSIRISQFAS